MKFYIQIPSDGRWGNPVNNSDFDLLSKDELKKLGWYEYVVENAPQKTNNYKIWYETKLVGDVVKMVWFSELKTGEELVTATKHRWAEIRYRRNSLLDASDYTQLPDSPFSEEEKKQWAIYRQQLRDLTTQTDPYNIIFPTSPLGDNADIGVHRVG